MTVASLPPVIELKESMRGNAHLKHTVQGGENTVEARNHNTVLVITRV